MAERSARRRWPVSRRGAWSVVAVLAVGLSGCSGAAAEPVPTPTTVDLSTYAPDADGNGVTMLAPADARSAVLAAVRAAGAVEVSGAYADAATGRSIQFSRSGGADTYTARIVLDGAPTEVVVDGSRAWLNPSPGVAALSGLPAGTWSCVGTTDAVLQRWASLLQPVELLDELTADASGLTAPADGTVGLLLGEEGATGVLTVTTTGRPLPTRLVRADPAGGLDVGFSGWGDETEPVEPPADC